MRKLGFADVRIVVSERTELVPIAAKHAEGCYRTCQDQEINRWIPLTQLYTRELAEMWCGVQAEEFRQAGLGIHYAVQTPDRFQGCIALKNTRWLESTVPIGTCGCVNSADDTHAHVVESLYEMVGDARRIDRRKGTVRSPR